MKKFFLLFLALGAVAFAGDVDGQSMIKAYSVVAAGVGLGLAAAWWSYRYGSVQLLQLLLVLLETQVLVVN